LKFKNKQINIFNTSVFIVLICFLPLFYYSTKFLINNWGYADAMINYSHGFIRRGLLGEIILWINQITLIKTSIIFSYLYIFITILNIFLYAIILKKISKNYLIFLFLFFNPALLFFILNDTLGYMRKELIMVTLMLFHCWICNSFHQKKINLKKYLIYFYSLILPGIIILTLMHDLQLFIIPFHFFLTLNIIDKKFNFLNIKSYFEKNSKHLYFYIVTIIPIFIFILFPSDLEKLKLIYDDLLILDPQIWWDPIRFTANSFTNATIAETGFMFSKDVDQTFGHLYKYAFLLLVSIGLIILIFNYILKAQVNIENQYFLIFSIAPFFLLFFIGRDWGRWISLASWVTVLFYLQFDTKIQKLNLKIFFSKKKFFNYLLIIFIFFYIFFISLPHCCKQQKIIGGLIDNFLLFSKIIFLDNNHINNTFRKN